jgi:hypothetical protein
MNEWERQVREAQQKLEEKMESNIPSTLRKLGWQWRPDLKSYVLELRCQAGMSERDLAASKQVRTLVLSRLDQVRDHVNEFISAATKETRKLLEDEKEDV